MCESSFTVLVASVKETLASPAGSIAMARVQDGGFQSRLLRGREVLRNGPSSPPARKIKHMITVQKNAIGLLLVATLHGPLSIKVKVVPFCVVSAMYVGMLVGWFAQYDGFICRPGPTRRFFPTPHDRCGCVRCIYVSLRYSRGRFPDTVRVMRGRGYQVHYVDTLGYLLCTCK